GSSRIRGTARRTRVGGRRWRETRPSGSGHSCPTTRTWSTANGGTPPPRRCVSVERATAAMDLQLVSVEWGRTTLAAFIEETRPVSRSSSMVSTSRTRPACGRDRAIELTEVVRPILDRLYPDWRAENHPSRNDEFHGERDAARRLLSRLDHH